MRRAVVVTMLLACATVHAQEPKVQPRVIDKDTTWTGAVTVDAPVHVTRATLTLAPGAVVTFKEGGVIDLGRGAGLSAVGTAEQPIRFVGENTGQVRGVGWGGTFEHVEVTGVGIADQHKRSWWLSCATGEGGITLRHCRITRSGGVTVALGGGPFEMTGCDFRECNQGIGVRGKGKALVASNTLSPGDVSVSGGIDAVVRDNVLLRGTISGWQTEKLVVEGNYVHQPEPKGSYGLLRTVGVIRNNVVRGGSWVTAQIGGEITGNVFVSLPHEEARKKEGGFDRNCTHEHICGLAPNATVTRNIFVGASYGAIMGIGDGTCSGAVIRNNTFDMRGSGHALYLNHLPKTDPKDVVVRNNLFVRSGSVLSEKPVDDTFSYLDYNLWSRSGLDKRYGRFQKIVIAGKKPGEAGFGGHDVPSFGRDGEQPAPEAVVENPTVEFPFTDEDLLARRHTVAEVLKVYRDAYAPKAGSPAIDAGDPADRDDPEVKDGKPDIGAVEAVN
ncbi:MAG TPA: hypothetical protein VMY39_05055 [Planctomycetota bacterium]|nr:hypothetical protein [Planctomycetota bacterium]